MDRRRSAYARVALPALSQPDQEWRAADRAPGPARRARARGPARRRVLARPTPARDPQPARALDALGLGLRLRQPVQGRGVLRQHPRDHRSQVGHAVSGAAARPRFRPAARARLRHLHAARARPEASARAARRDRRGLRVRRDRGAAAFDHRHGLRRSRREGRDRAGRSLEELPVAVGPACATWCERASTTSTVSRFRSCSS